VHPVSKELQQHYSKTFRSHGPSSLGVDWGADVAKANLRYDKMLNVMARQANKGVSLLDVGCGYGGLCLHAENKNIEINYTGIDVAQNMIDWARGNVKSGKFLFGDILDGQFKEMYDYVVCNGILTQKLDVSKTEMDKFADQLIRKMFSICNIGIAFNVMTTKANYFAANLYYRDPVELMNWCLSEMTRNVVLDHAYPLYEYTLYLYRQPRLA
jgi:SAM-dependent methyltransferase